MGLGGLLKGALGAVSSFIPGGSLVTGGLSALGSLLGGGGAGDAAKSGLMGLLGGIGGKAAGLDLSDPKTLALLGLGGLSVADSGKQRKEAQAYNQKKLDTMTEGLRKAEGVWDSKEGLRSAGMDALLGARDAGKPNLDAASANLTGAMGAGLPSILQGQNLLASAPGAGAGMANLGQLLTSGAAGAGAGLRTAGGNAVMDQLANGLPETAKAGESAIQDVLKRRKDRRGSGAAARRGASGGQEGAGAFM